MMDGMNKFYGTGFCLKSKIIQAIWKDTKEEKECLVIAVLLSLVPEVTMLMVCNVSFQTFPRDM